MVTLILLFATSMLIGHKYQNETLVEPKYRYTALGAFIVYSMISTYYNAKKLRHIHSIK